jgi:hypothetical protein
MPDTIAVQERLPPGAAAVLINRTHTYTDMYLLIDAQQKKCSRQSTASAVLARSPVSRRNAKPREIYSSSSGGATRSCSTHYRKPAADRL